MKNRKARKALIIVLSSLLAIVLAGLAFGAYILGQFDASRGDLGNVIESPAATASAEPAAIRSENILVMGTDTRGVLGSNMDTTGSRSDTMMILHIEANREQVQIVSLPRDTWVKISGYNKGKLNWALSYGGAGLAIKTIEKFLSIHIDHVVMIDFNGVINLSKVLNGVTVDNPEAFCNGRDAFKTIYCFKAGKIRLKGGEALAYVRERHALKGGDGDRVKHQQAFATAVVKRILEKDVLTNPATLVSLSKSIGELVLTDRSLDSAWLANKAVEMANFKAENIRTFTLPIKSTGYEGQHYVMYTNPADIAALSWAFANDELDRYVLPKQAKTKN